MSLPMAWPGQCNVPATSAGPSVARRRPGVGGRLVRSPAKDGGQARRKPTQCLSAARRGQGRVACHVGSPERRASGSGRNMPITRRTLSRHFRHDFGKFPNVGGENSQSHCCAVGISRDARAAARHVGQSQCEGPVCRLCARRGTFRQRAGSSRIPARRAPRRCHSEWPAPERGGRGRAPASCAGRASMHAPRAGVAKRVRGGPQAGVHAPARDGGRIQAAGAAGEDKRMARRPEG